MNPALMSFNQLCVMKENDLTIASKVGEGNGCLLSPLSLQKIRLEELNIYVKLCVYMYASEANILKNDGLM